MPSNRLFSRYQKEIIPSLKQGLGIENDLAVPRLEKIVIASGVTDEQHRSEAIKNMSEQMTLFTGQTPIVTRAKKSIADFKLREGDAVGLKVTLRRQRMYEFLDKLISVVLPKVKDFKGVSLTAFDHHGNYSLGLTEQIIFPEVEYDKIDKVRGLQISLVTSTENDEAARRLLELFGFPFEKDSSTLEK